MAPCHLIHVDEGLAVLEPERVTRAQRELRSLVAEVGANDPEALASLVELAEWLRFEGLPAAARAQLARGYSWTELARPLNVTRQAARQRFHNVRMDTVCPEPT